MNEKLTDRARKVMQIANQEALRLNHGCVAPEHILVGLVREGTGCAARILNEYDISLRRVRNFLAEVRKPGSDMVSMGKLPRAPTVTRVIENAVKEASNRGNNYIGTEHILLGLLYDGPNPVYRFLASAMCTELPYKHISDAISEIGQGKEDSSEVCQNKMAEQESLSSITEEKPTFEEKSIFVCKSCGSQVEFGRCFFVGSKPLVCFECFEQGILFAARGASTLKQLEGRSKLESEVQEKRKINPFYDK
jgi:ATP-dependent Clp protease ATP-binding subunit ClpA